MSTITFYSKVISLWGKHGSLPNLLPFHFKCPKAVSLVSIEIVKYEYLWIIGTVQKYWLFSNNFFFQTNFFVVKFPWLLSFRMLTLNISFCVSLAGPVTLNARKGTLRRKRQLRELAEHHNMGYEEDLLDNTPYKKTRRHKVSSVMFKTIAYCLWNYSFNLFNCQHSVYNSSPVKGFSASLSYCLANMLENFLNHLAKSTSS